MEQQELLEKKWAVLIDACKSYYVDSRPTGLSDIEYDNLEQRALEEDNFSVRDYIFHTYLKGTKGKNSYIEKIKKEKVLDSTMKDALIKFEKDLGKQIYIDLKYDGTSIAIYIDPMTGIPKRILTCGNLNLSTEGIDQTYKLMHFLPKRFPKGIVAIQAEALVDTKSVPDPEKARQKANGLINSKYCDEEVNSILTLRAYRYYVDDSPNGVSIKNLPYPEVLKSFGTVVSPEGRILFTSADVFTTKDLGDWCEKDIITTSTGSFLADGMVIYNAEGSCIKAMKFSGAGNNSEGKIRTKVLGILWNNQTPKGKDSWSANVLIEPITLRGTVIRKPSAGSVSKLVKNNVTPGAEVSVILANSTIPMISDVYSGGNGDFSFPKCSCGYEMSQKDIYGSNLKCGNPVCTERINRMRSYLKRLNGNFDNLDLNSFLVLDRFKWQETTVNKSILLNLVKEEKMNEYFEYLSSFLKTDLQKRNLELIWKASYLMLKDAINKE